MTKEKKESKLSIEIAELEKLVNETCGAGSFQVLDKQSITQHPATPTGIPLLDKALGIGGLPISRSSEVSGDTGTGKTTTALTCAASAQKHGYIVLYIDAEHALDMLYAVKLGIDLTKFGLVQPNSAEEAISLIQTVLESGQKVFIVVDSVAAMTPQVEIDGEPSEANMGAQARLMSKMARKCAAPLGKSECILLLLNQVRSRLGGYGTPDVTTGGRGLPFWYCMRIQIKRGDKIESGGAHIGNKAKFNIIKNKAASPYQLCEVDLIFGEGFDNLGPLIDSAVSAGVIEKAGSWFSHAGERLGQGRDAVKSILKSNLELLGKIEEELKAKEST